MVDNPLWGQVFGGGMRGWNGFPWSLSRTSDSKSSLQYKKCFGQSPNSYVSFPRKNIYPLLCCFPNHLRQNGNLPQVGMKIKKFWNRQPAGWFVYFRFHFAGANMNGHHPNHPTSASMEIPGLSKSWRALMDLMDLDGLMAPRFGIWPTDFTIKINQNVGEIYVIHRSWWRIRGFLSWKSVEIKKIWKFVQIGPMCMSLSIARLYIEISVLF